MLHHPSRILCIDDDVDILNILTALLEPADQVIACTSGREALRKAASMPTDCILLDIIMPEMSGVTVLNKLKNHPVTRHIPVIMLTAKKDVLSEKYIELGAAGVIGKPINPKNFSAQLDRLLNGVPYNQLLA